MRSAPDGLCTIRSIIHASHWAGRHPWCGAQPLQGSRLEPLWAVLSRWAHAQQHRRLSRTRICPLLSSRGHLHLFETVTLNGWGASVRPNLPVMMGFSEPAGRAKVKLCIRLTNIRNNSIFASCSPIHTRFPKSEIGEGAVMIQPCAFEAGV